MDRVQSFILHDKVVEKLEDLKEQHGYSPAQIFDVGVQIFDYMLRMKEEGWEVGIWKLTDDGKSIRQRKMRFPHEEQFSEAEEHDPDYDELEDEDDDDDGWLNVKWKND